MAPEQVRDTDRARFPETRWSLVLAAAQDGTEQSGGALAQLCSSYWYPVFVYFVWNGHDADAAKDLTQAFFLHLIENRTVGRADELRGSFRGFLIGCLKHFAANERERERALKRGGHIRFVEFDLAAAEWWFHDEDHSADATQLDARFDRHWARLIAQRALERVRAQFAGDLPRFERLKGFLVSPDDSGSYEAAARDLGVPVSLVKTAIHRLRRDYRDALRREVSLTVTAPHEIDGELRYLVTVLASD